MATTHHHFPRMHVSLYVSDLTATVNFYTAFFGQPAEKIKQGYAKYILERPSLIISFLENPERVQSNFGHLGIQVETKDIMEKYLSTAHEKGMVIKEEIGTACCYALQDKFWVSDPDGIQWEIYYFHEDVEFNDPHYSEESQSSCCTSPEKQKVGASSKEGKEKIALSSLTSTEASCPPGSGCC